VAAVLAALAIGVAAAPADVPGLTVQSGKSMMDMKGMDKPAMDKPAMDKPGMDKPAMDMSK
jgi:hypothetical protein